MRREGSTKALLRIFLCVVLLPTIRVYAQEHPLLVGMRLADTEFKGWKYGHRMERKRLNCVQFMEAVVEDLIQRSLTQEEQDALFINHIGSARHLNSLIVADDERIRGIQTALLNMKKGEVVKPEEAMPGDFVQFWRRRGNKWHGHAAIILDVINYNGKICALLFGSHESLGRVGVANYELSLDDPKIKTYVIRFKS